VNRSPATQAVAIEEPDLPESPARSEPFDRGPIVAVRTSYNAWWCPDDDTAMPLNLTECPTCGFQKP
jgi:hypothetical protein